MNGVRNIPALTYKLTVRMTKSISLKCQQIFLHFCSENSRDNDHRVRHLDRKMLDSPGSCNQNITLLTSNAMFILCVNGTFVCECVLCV